MTYSKTQRISTAVALVAVLALAAPARGAGGEERAQGMGSGVLARAWEWVVGVVTTGLKGAVESPSNTSEQPDDGVTPAPPPRCVEDCDKGAGIDPNG